MALHAGRPARRRCSTTRPPVRASTWSDDAPRRRHARRRHPSTSGARSGAPAPGDRAAAVAAAPQRRRRCCSTSPPTPSSTSRSASGSPARAREAVHGHLLVRVGRFARATVVLEHTGTARATASSSRSSPATARRSPWSPCRSGTTTPTTWRSTTLSSAATPRVRHIAVTHRRRHRPVQHQRLATPAPAASFEACGVYFADAGQHLEHRLVRRPRRAALPDPTSSTRARSRATPRTPCGSATC